MKSKKKNARYMFEKLKYVRAGGYFILFHLSIQKSFNIKFFVPPHISSYFFNFITTA